MVLVFLVEVLVLELVLMLEVFVLVLEVVLVLVEVTDGVLMIFGSSTAAGFSGFAALELSSVPPGLPDSSPAPLSFFRCCRFSLWLTLVSQVPADTHTDNCCHGCM